MTSDEAFNRRFYADRAELSSLGIELKVEKQSEGSYEAETYTLPPENFYLPAIEFSDQELGGAAHGAEPARRRVRLRGAAAPGAPAALLGQALPAVGARAAVGAARRSPPRRAGASSRSGCRRSRPRSSAARRSCSTTTRWAATPRRSARWTPTTCSSAAASSTSSGYAHEREAVRVFRLSRIRGKVGYSSKAEHDFQRPEDFDPRAYATRADWQLGEQQGTARIWLSDRIEWLVRRHLGTGRRGDHRGRRRRAWSSRPPTATRAS